MSDSLPMDPALEAFFVATALQLGTSPVPLSNIPARHQLEWDITQHFIESGAAYGQFETLQKLYKNYSELGGKGKDTTQDWFYSRLAEAYLTWVYKHAPAG